MKSSYKAIVRNSPGWRDKSAATLGVSVSSPNWQGDKFAAILELAAAHFKIIRIDVTDMLYRHNFMATGASAEHAAAQAASLGSLWLTQHQDIISASPIRPLIIRWGEWFEHCDFHKALRETYSLYIKNDKFRRAVLEDVLGFYNRKDQSPSPQALKHGLNYVLEEIAVMTLQARELPGVKLYPGDDLKSLALLRRGEIDGAPSDLCNEQFAKIKFHKKGIHMPLTAASREDEYPTLQAMPEQNRLPLSA